MDSLQRRQLLITAVGSSLLAVGTTREAYAQSPVKALDITPKSIVGETIRIPALPTTDKEIESWKDIKKQISETSIWLKAFDNSYEEGALAELEKITSEEKKPTYAQCAPCRAATGRNFVSA